MTSLPAFTGDKTPCLKCGNDQDDTEWQPNTMELTAWGRLMDTRRYEDSAEPGWLLRTCGRCRYQWAEATQDASVGG